MNEAETRAEPIDPPWKAAGWGVVEGSPVQREHGIARVSTVSHGRLGKRFKMAVPHQALSDNL